MGRLTLDRHTRRDLLQAGLALAGLGLLVGCGISLSPLEPPAKVARVGFLWAGTSTSRGDEAFRLGLRELGYVEGQNVTIERRFAEEQPDRLPDLAAELVRLNVDVIVAVTGPEIRAAREATSTIPIVMVTAGDPVAEGFVASLAHPGGNITGLTNLGPETAGKRLELLKEAAPGISRVAVLWVSPSGGSVFREARSAAQALGLEVQSLEVRGAEDFEAAFEAARSGGADALVTARDTLTFLHRARIVEFAARNRLPAIYDGRDFAESGGLMAHGTDRIHLHRRAATYVDKILRGARPAELPVERPTRFDFVINLRTARELGLTIPQSVLLQATEVIQ